MASSNTCKKISSRRDMEYLKIKRPRSSVKDSQAYRDVSKIKTAAKKRNIVKLKTVLLFTAVFSLLFVICYRQVNIYTQGVEIQEKNSELKKYSDDIAQLQLEIERNVDIKKIESYTMNELGMVKPEKYQIVYISPDTEDEMISETSNTSLFSGFFNNLILGFRSIFGG